MELELMSPTRRLKNTRASPNNKRFYSKALFSLAAGRNAQPAAGNASSSDASQSQEQVGPASQ